MKAKKLLIFLMTVTVFVMLGACSNEDTSKDKDVETNKSVVEKVNESSFPIVKDKITLDFFAGQAPLTAEDWNDVLIYNEYEKMTNININWEMVPRQSLGEKRNIVLAGGGNLPDAFHTASIPSTDILKYGQQGIFIPLNDLIDKYAPNFKKRLEENPEIRKSITFPDGNIYSFPFLKDSDFLSHIIGAKPFINKEWLESLGMDMPETTEDFYEYLKAVKEGDPNGNGENDEIPYGTQGIDLLVTYLTGSFGIANKGQANANIDLDPETNEVRFYPITDGYKELLSYLHKLYSEELIQQNIFSMESDQYHANFADGLYGSTIDWGPEHIFGEEVGSVLTGMPALEGPNGEKKFTGLYPTVATIGAFLITSDNEHPEATVRWIDHFYGEEGMKLFFLGIEGETYEVNADGEYEFMDHIKNSKDGLSPEQEVAKYLTFPGGAYPSVSTQEFFTGAESSSQSVEAAEALKAYLIEEPWEAFQYTEEENKILASIGADIEKYVTEMRDKFIVGDASLSEWDNYVETIKQIGLNDYMEVKESAFKRYQKN